MITYEIHKLKRVNSVRNTRRSWEKIKKFRCKVGTFFVHFREYTFK